MSNMCKHIYERDKERTNTNAAALIAQVNLRANL